MKFFSRHRVQSVSGAHPTSYAMDTAALALGIRWRGRERDHSPPCSAEVTNAWSYASIPQYIFMAYCLIQQEIPLHGAVLVNHRDNFAFTLKV
jgi:hypothetical protein